MTQQHGVICIQPSQGVEFVDIQNYKRCLYKESFVVIEKVKIVYLDILLSSKIMVFFGHSWTYINRGDGGIALSRLCVALIFCFLNASAVDSIALLMKIRISASMASKSIYFSWISPCLKRESATPWMKRRNPSSDSQSSRCNAFEVKSQTILAVFHRFLKVLYSKSSI